MMRAQTTPCLLVAMQLCQCRAFMVLRLMHESMSLLMLDICQHGDLEAEPDVASWTCCTILHGIHQDDFGLSGTAPA